MCFCVFFHKASVYIPDNRSQILLLIPFPVIRSEYIPNRLPPWHFALHQNYTMYKNAIFFIKRSFRKRSFSVAVHARNVYTRNVNEISFISITDIYLKEVFHERGNH